MSERTPIEQLKWDIEYYTKERDKAERYRKIYQLALDALEEQQETERLVPMKVVEERTECEE